ncbi:LysM peptidoglycan-binding domain-containing protein [Demequina sediminicola]|uniref:LysM peptidoglycan-binding domain-containing protein n=1 Tax=Demequina sediminicola TaxID=1095026 RepID=UPI000784911B|nr:LysM peptidoglycan-binding domain-containing protein [Demequina sediminicola]
MGRITFSQRTLRTTVSCATAAIALSALGASPAFADEQHRVSPGETVSQLAARYGASVSSIIESNGLNSHGLIVIGQTLTIPSSAQGAASAQAQTHTVSDGDTVWGLARAYGTTVSAIAAANDLGPTAVIRLGQTITIPGSSATTTANTAGTPTHTVAEGDTVWDLARQYGTSVSAINSANNLAGSTLIRPGQELSIPGGTAAGSTSATSNTPLATSTSVNETSSDAPVTYTVAAGDTLASIAANQGVPLANIVATNDIKNPSLITVGQELSISGGTPTGLVGDTFAGRTYDAPTVEAANRNKAALNASEVPSRDQMQAMIVAAAHRYGVDPALAQAIAYQESGFNMRAVSPANAVGAMQVIPSSGEWASDMVGRDLDLLTPVDNVEAGISILSHLTRDGQDLSIAIAGYYQGEAGVRKYGMYDDTKRYVASVLALMEQY